MTDALSAPPPFPGAAAPWLPEKGFPDWKRILQQSGDNWARAVGAADGPKVLIGSNTGMHGAVANLDSVLSVALTMKGARVSRVFCDGVLQGCLVATYSDTLSPEVIAGRGLVNRLCKACFNRGTHTHRPSGLPEHRLSAFLAFEDYASAQSLAASVPAASIPTWTLDGMAIGEHAYAGALRYYAKGSLEDEPLAEAVVRRYLEGAILAAWAYARIIEQDRPDVAVLHHGIYSPQGIAAEVCRKRGVRVVTWVVAYRRGCFIFSHDDTYHHTMMTEPTDTWTELELADEARAATHDYLASRSDGGMDWIYFHKEGRSGFDHFAQQRGIDTSKPVVAMLTNVMWDAQLHYPANAFSNMAEWVVETVRHFVSRPELELVIRIHPAEVHGAITSRHRVADIIRSEFPDLPRNIHVVEPDEDASTYAIAHAANAVVIFGTKMGVELTPLGKPVIVAGEAWIRNKGLTQDAIDKQHYFSLLDQLPFSRDSARPDTERALRYAYHFFFRRMIPLPFLEPNGTGAMFNVAISDVVELSAGRYAGLDVITNGIIDGMPFVYPDEAQFGS